jgi:hypothetical protein
VAGKTNPATTLVLTGKAVDAKDRFFSGWLERYCCFFETFATTDRHLKVFVNFSLAFLAFLGDVNEALQLEKLMFVRSEDKRLTAAGAM